MDICVHGSYQDAWGTASQLGFSANNVMNWQASATGTKDAYRSLAMSTANYSANVSRGMDSTKDFFANKEENKNDIT